jgi:hypothetical protein
LRPHRLLAVFSLLVLGGCGGDNPQGPQLPATGVTFSYGGGGGGTFSVTGDVPTGSEGIASRDWAAGLRNLTDDAYVIQALHARGGGRYDIAYAYITRTTVGSTSITAGCNPDVSACSMVQFGVNMSQADENYNFVCVLTGGSISLTEITSERIKGSFSGTGICFTPSGVSSAFSVTNGTFDVPLIGSAPF